MSDNAFADLQMRQQRKHMPHGSSLVMNNDMDAVDVPLQKTEQDTKTTLRNMLTSGVAAASSTAPEHSLENPVTSLLSTSRPLINACDVPFGETETYIAKARELLEKMSSGLEVDLASDDLKHSLPVSRMGNYDNKMRKQKVRLV